MEGGPTVRYDGLLSRSKDKVEVEFVRAVTGDEYRQSGRDLGEVSGPCGQDREGKTHQASWGF